MIRNACFDCQNRPICRFSHELDQLELKYGYERESTGRHFNTIHCDIETIVEKCKYYILNPKMAGMRDGSCLKIPVKENPDA